MACTAAREEPCKCVAVISGTVEIHRPLHHHLSKRLAESVFLVDGESREGLKQSLLRLSERYEVWVFACNEVQLNRTFLCLEEMDAAARERIIVPGTAHAGRVYNPRQLCDKAVVMSLFADRAFKHFETVRAEMAGLESLREGDAGGIGLEYPLIIKPADKGVSYIFNVHYPSKLAVLESGEKLGEWARENEERLAGCRFILQEPVEGENVSWVGYADAGRIRGYGMTSLVKSPTERYGGTTTLARLDDADEDLKGAAAEIAGSFGLDGIFEIEFIRRDGRLLFPHEINARPWLQVSMLLKQSRDAVCEYLEKKGFTLLPSAASRPRPSRFWGSALNYLELNMGRQPVSFRTLLRTVRYDVRYGSSFSWWERVRYTLVLMRTYARCSIRKPSCGS